MLPLHDMELQKKEWRGQTSVPSASKSDAKRWASASSSKETTPSFSSSHRIKLLPSGLRRPSTCRKPCALSPYLRNFVPRKDLFHSKKWRLQHCDCLLKANVLCQQLLSYVNNMRAFFTKPLEKNCVRMRALIPGPNYLDRKGSSVDKGISKEPCRKVREERADNTFVSWSSASFCCIRVRRVNVEAVSELGCCVASTYSGFV